MGTVMEHRASLSRQHDSRHPRSTQRKDCTQKSKADSAWSIDDLQVVQVDIDVPGREHDFFWPIWVLMSLQHVQL